MLEETDVLITAEEVGRELENYKMVCLLKKWDVWLEVCDYTNGNTWITSNQICTHIE